MPWCVEIQVMLFCLLEGRRCRSSFSPGMRKAHRGPISKIIYVFGVDSVYLTFYIDYTLFFNLICECELEIVLFIVFEFVSVSGRLIWMIHLYGSLVV